MAFHGRFGGGEPLIRTPGNSCTTNAVNNLVPNCLRPALTQTANRASLGAWSMTAPHQLIRRVSQGG